MKTANIFCLIDCQKGFMYELPGDKGGNLCVPGGTEIIEPVVKMINFIKQDPNNVFLGSRDVHHPEYYEFAATFGLEPYVSSLHMKRENEKTEIVPEGTNGSFEQKLWPIHCVEGTESCQLPEEVMNALPEGFKQSVKRHEKVVLLSTVKENEALFMMVSKGTTKDLGAYSMVMENDGKTKTGAFTAFNSIITKLKQDGIENVNILVGGLAGNFCVEFSHNDIHKYFVPMIEAHGINPNVYVLKDTCANVLIEDPSGEWPDAENTWKRMESKGSTIITVDDFIAKFDLPQNAKNNNYNKQTYQAYSNFYLGC